MLTITWEPLPAVISVAILLIAAVSYTKTLRVPNALTLPAILAGWGYAIYLDATRQAAGPNPAILVSLLCTFAALMVLLPAYNNYGLAAGCVKAQMAFGAWTGCALALVPALAITVGTTLGGWIFTWILARMYVARLPEDEPRGDILYPAQVTMTVFAVLGALACWVLSTQG